MSRGQTSDNSSVTWVAEEDQSTTLWRHIAWGSAQSKDRNVKEGKWSEKGGNRESEDVECKLWERPSRAEAETAVRSQLADRSKYLGEYRVFTLPSKPKGYNCEHSYQCRGRQPWQSNNGILFSVQVLSFCFHPSTSSACQFFATQISISLLDTSTRRPSGRVVTHPLKVITTVLKCMWGMMWWTLWALQ